MDIKRNNYWNNSFVFTFDKNYFLTNNRFSLNNIFKKNNDLQNFLFYLHEKFFMNQILTVNELKNKNKIFKKSFEKLNQIQLNFMKKISAKKAILDICGDNSVYKIPLDKKPRLFGFSLKIVFI